MPNYLLLSMVERVQSVLVRADNACVSIVQSRVSGHSSQTLAQLYQALLDGKGLVQVEYDRIVGQYSSKAIAEADGKPYSTLTAGLQYT